MLLTLGCLPNGLSLFSLFSNSARGYLERPTNVVRGDFRAFRGVGGLLGRLVLLGGFKQGENEAKWISRGRSLPVKKSHLPEIQGHSRHTVSHGFMERH